MRFFDPDARARVLARYRGQPLDAESYATVRDYCDSADCLPSLCGRDGDLKNVQRPWMVKAVLSRVAPGGRLLEIGGGEPIVATALAELGYAVTVIDPYDGSGHGPTAYQAFVAAYPEVRLVRAPFGRHTGALAHETYDAIYSVSVLEHLPHDGLPELFRGIAERLVPGGHSIHCIDHVLDGWGTEHHLKGLRIMMAWQRAMTCGGEPDTATTEAAAEGLDRLLEAAGRDVETFFLSPQGHQLWRGALAYDEFPFRKVISVQSAAATPVAARR